MNTNFNLDMIPYIIILIVMILLPGCDTIYHHNTVYQYDVIYDINDTVSSCEDDLQNCAIADSY